MIRSVIKEGKPRKRHLIGTAENVILCKSSSRENALFLLKHVKLILLLREDQTFSSSQLL